MGTMIGRPSNARSKTRSRAARLAAAVPVLGAVLATGALAATTDFTEPASSPERVGALPIFVAAADLTGDGDVDLAVASQQSDNVTILNNNGSGDFARRSPVPAGDSPRSVAAADLDGDADTDLAVANANPDRVTILRNNGGGNFDRPRRGARRVGDQPLAVAAADLDGDGDQDLAVANSGSGDVTVLRNNGAGTLREPASSPEPVGNFPSSIVIADLDGDGSQDIAVANGNSDNVTILRNNGAGNFGQPGSSPEATGDSPRSVAAADFDLDGDQDLAVANENVANVTILRNQGSGNFTEATSSPEPARTRPISLVAADLDGDGDQDLAVANASTGDVTILRNL